MSCGPHSPRFLPKGFSSSPSSSSQCLRSPPSPVSSLLPPTHPRQHTAYFRSAGQSVLPTVVITAWKTPEAQLGTITIYQALPLGRPCAGCYMSLSHLILKTVLECKHHYLYFTGRESQAQNGKANCPMSWGYCIQELRVPARPGKASLVSCCPQPSCLGRPFPGDRKGHAVMVPGCPCLPPSSQAEGTSVVPTRTTQPLETQGTQGGRESKIELLEELSYRP